MRRTRTLRKPTPRKVKLPPIISEEEKARLRKREKDKKRREEVLRKREERLRKDVGPFDIEEMIKFENKMARERAERKKQLPKLREAMRKHREKKEQEIKAVTERLVRPKKQPRTLKKQPTRFFDINTERAERQDNSIRQKTRNNVERIAGVGQRQNLKDSALTRKDWGFSDTDWELMRRRMNIMIETEKPNIDIGGFRTELTSPLRTERQFKQGFKATTFAEQQRLSDEHIEKLRREDAIRRGREMVEDSKEFMGNVARLSGGIGILAREIEEEQLANVRPPEQRQNTFFGVRPRF